MQDCRALIVCLDKYLKPALHEETSKFCFIILSLTGISLPATVHHLLWQKSGNLESTVEDCGRLITWKVLCSEVKWLL